MKFILFLAILFTCELSMARGGGGADSEAEYIVPTDPQFMAYSRFKVQIVEPFKGPQTQRISYIFPEFLVGKANRVITLEKIPSLPYSYVSEELTAHCATFEDEFSCNVYVNKNESSKEVTAFAKESCAGNSLAKNTFINTETDFGAETSLRHLQEMNLSEDELNGFTGVIQSFFCNEPAGFLTYDFQ